MSHVALITGGGTGIGRGIALALARRGVSLALVGRREAPLEATAAQARALGATAAVAIPTDLADEAQRAALWERAQTLAGPVDVLVHCAGLLAGGTLDDLADGQIERAVAVNLTTPLALTRLAAEDLRARRGAVVFIGSGMSIVPLPAASVYAATKAGLRAGVEALRYEMESAGVRVVMAYPPGTATEMVRGMAAAARWPGYRLAAPEAVGEHIVRALLAGRAEVRFSGGDRLLAMCYTLAPWAVRAVFRAQRPRLTHMMRAPAAASAREE